MTTLLLRLLLLHRSSFSILRYVRVGQSPVRAVRNIPARGRERIKRVFVRARASCLSNTSYLPEVSGDSVTSGRERGSIHGPRGQRHVPPLSTLLLKRSDNGFGRRDVLLGPVPSSKAS